MLNSILSFIKLNTIVTSKLTTNDNSDLLNKSFENLPDISVTLSKSFIYLCRNNLKYFTRPKQILTDFAGGLVTFELAV